MFTMQVNPKNGLCALILSIAHYINPNRLTTISVITSLTSSVSLSTQEGPLPLLMICEQIIYLLLVKVRLSYGQGWYSHGTLLPVAHTQVQEHLQ